MDPRELVEVNYSEEPPLIDRPGATDSPERVLAAIEALERVDLRLGGRRALLKGALPLIQQAAEADPSRPVLAIFVGSALGAAPRAVAEACRRKELKISVIALERNRDCVARARELCRDYPEIEFSISDFSRLADRGRECVDVALASGLFRRCSPEEAVSTLNVLGRIARRGFAAQELLRHPAALLSAQIAGALLGGGSSPELRREAGQMVRRSLTLEEWAEVAPRTALPGLTIWPRGVTRVSLMWERLVVAERVRNQAEEEDGEEEPALGPIPAPSV